MMVTFPDRLRRHKVRKMACDFPMKNIVANYRRFWNYFKCPKSISFLYFVYKRDIEIDGWREGGRKEEKNRQRKGGREGGEGGGEREGFCFLIQEWVLLLTLLTGLLTCPPFSDLISIIYKWSGVFQWPCLLVFQCSYTLTCAFFTGVSSVVFHLWFSIYPLHQTLELVQNLYTSKPNATTAPRNSFLSLWS